MTYVPGSEHRAKTSIFQDGRPKALVGLLFLKIRLTFGMNPFETKWLPQPYKKIAMVGMDEEAFIFIF